MTSGYPLTPLRGAAKRRKPRAWEVVQLPLHCVQNLRCARLRVEKESVIDKRAAALNFALDLWRVRLSVQDTALSRLKDGFDSRTRCQLQAETAPCSA